MKKWLGNLRFWQKILLIIGSFVLPFGVLAFFTFASYQENIAITALEESGVAVMRPLSTLLKLINSHHLLVQRYAMGEKSLAGEIAPLQRMIDKEFDFDFGPYAETLELTPSGLAVHGHSGVSLEKLRSEWQDLKGKWNRLSQDESRVAHEHLIEMVQVLIHHVGDTSTLSLDPALDSYYLMDAAVFRMPVLQARLSAAALLGLSRSEHPEGSESARLAGLLAEIRDDGEAILSQDVATAISEAPKSFGKRTTLSAKITPALSEFETAIDGLVAQLAGSKFAEKEQLLAAAEQADEAGFRFWQTDISELEAQLALRAAYWNERRVTAIILTGSALVISTILAGFLVRYVTRSLSRLTKAANSAARQGELAGEVSDAGSDEIGQLANAFSGMIERFRDVAGVAEKLAAGDLSVRIHPLSPADVMGHALEKMVANLESVAKLAGQMADGDLRIEVKPLSEKDTMGNALVKMVANLSTLAGHVQKAAIVMNSSVTDIAATAKEQQATTSEVAATTTEIGATSKEIYATSRELLKAVNEVNGVADDTAELANSGQMSIVRMEETMGLFVEAVTSINGKLAVLNEKAANINQVVTTITKVADQTNLLSLNAAIEAEKAGEYGRGFAVVATEIRRLADQTAVASYDIEQMVKEMQSAAAAGVMGMDKFGEQVRRGVQEVRQVSGQLAQIIQQVQALTPRFSTVHEGMQAQAIGADQITQALLQLSEATQQTADSLRQSNGSIEKLHDASRGMLSSLDGFKLRVA